MKNVGIKMEMLDSIEEKVFPVVEKKNPFELMTLRQEVDSIRDLFEQLRKKLSPILEKYSSLLPSVRVRRRVCGECNSSAIFAHGDFFVCNDCCAFYGWQDDEVKEVVKSPPSFSVKIRSKVKSFAVLLNDKGLGDELLFDYERFIEKAVQNGIKLPLSQIVLVCLLLRDDKKVPKNVQISKSKQSLETNLKLVSEIFSLVGWTFPSKAVKKLVKEKMKGEVDKRVDPFL